MNDNQFKQDFRGWETPNTYDTNFADPPQESGVYVITRFVSLSDGIREIVYVGSAKNLYQRYQRHEVRRVLQVIYGHTQFWFIKCLDYREFEKSLIKRFQPKFNKQWR